MFPTISPSPYQSTASRPSRDSRRQPPEASRTLTNRYAQSSDQPTRHRAAGSRNDSLEDSHDHERTQGGGYSLWNQVVTTASSLTVDLGKAWATTVTTYNGEETPPGQESHLTRAMKAYHLGKARDPSDLPPWLFDDHERRPAPRSFYNDPRRSDDYETRRQPPPREQPKSRGLRDIYDAATTSDIRSERSTPSRPPPDDSPSRSKATNRLKELRDAKRSAYAAQDRYDEPVGRSQSLYAEDRHNVPPQVDRRPKVGLPSGPGPSGVKSRRF